MPKKDLLLAPAGEAFLILIAGIVGWVAHQPLVFASLGPTAYELIETPERRSAQPYSVFVGHLVGVAAGFAALFIADSWHTPPISGAGVPLHRVWAAMTAAGLTVLLNLLLRAAQPAAVSTTLLVSLGIMQSPKDAGVLMGGVIIMIVVGEPLRHLRLRQNQNAKSPG